MRPDAVRTRTARAGTGMRLLGPPPQGHGDLAGWPGVRVLRPGGDARQRRLPRLRTALPPARAGCAGTPPGPVCGDCGNEHWLDHKARCARCVLQTRLARLLGSEPDRITRGLQPLHEALLAAERPEAVISWLQPSRPGHKILARLASGELDLSHTALDAVTDLHRNATGHITALLTALGTLPRRDTHLACLERDIAAILDSAANQDMRQLLRRHATWELLRHARATARQAPLTSGIRHGQTATLTRTHSALDAGHPPRTLGTRPISIPDPLAAHLHAPARHRRHLSQVPAGGPGPWLFPGLHPGQPVLPATISHRLARIGIDTVTRRPSPLLQLPAELPPPILADRLAPPPNPPIPPRHLPRP